MKRANQYNPILKKTTHIFCAIIGVTFFISGFTKAVDPWGTAIKFEEYFSVYGFDFLTPLSRVLAVWLCGAEMMMGCMIFCRVRLRLISIFALISMTIFTIVTILSINYLPVDDCGCFGDAFHLTPWQTLIKNLIILPMVITIWWRYRPDKILVYKPREVILATIFCIVTMGFSTYNFLHLPLIDFLPYKVGVDLLSEVESTTADLQYSVVLIYRNIASGELREFTIDDTAWQDSEQWEWVETKTRVAERGILHTVADFSLSSFNGDVATIDILSQAGRLNIVSIADLSKLKPRCQARVEKYIGQAEALGIRTIIATPNEFSSKYVKIGDSIVECFHIDKSVSNSMMRASVGVVELSDAIITSKRSCIDL
ncbi:MAG: BT_3928 family protein [Rikenellaceae bacterium]